MYIGKKVNGVFIALIIAISAVFLVATIYFQKGLDKKAEDLGMESEKLSVCTVDLQTCVANLQSAEEDIEMSERDLDSYDALYQQKVDEADAKSEEITQLNRRVTNLEIQKAGLNNQLEQLQQSSAQEIAALNAQVLEARRDANRWKERFICARDNPGAEC